MIRLTDYIYDLIQNSIQAKSKHIELTISEGPLLEVLIKDDGIGMDEATLKRVESFTYTSRTTRKVGLGLSLIHDLTKQTDGYFKIESKQNIGTTLFLGFNSKHIDFPEMGDLAELVSDIYMHQDIKHFTFIFNTICVDLDELGLDSLPKTFKRRNQLYEIVKNKLIEVANENTR
ncbi:ATP-binding protein [Acholeplasma vituli]|uniref:ATP-binding protein n=1 Tax=Paracholeplasma vituli TaxID=69473 RepID=A0ABT2PUR0_9MOLU|nr:ATP-binding protein [Paracholeplasma vituli]MCU0104683.1 ATP-binding protein [Paracholeplasma vituli]